MDEIAPLIQAALPDPQPLDLDVRVEMLRDEKGEAIGIRVAKRGSSSPPRYVRWKGREIQVSSDPGFRRFDGVKWTELSSRRIENVMDLASHVDSGSIRAMDIERSADGTYLFIDRYPAAPGGHLGLAFDERGHLAQINRGR